MVWVSQAMSKNNIESILSYTDFGWIPIPVHTVYNGICSCYKGASCPSAGKHPVESGWQDHGHLNESDLLDYWSRYPEYNIGLTTGIKSGFIVIDVDAGGMQALIGRDLPVTVTVVTGSGGRHFYYKHPGGHVKSDSNVLPKVDSRGDGGQIIAPPSIHKSGKSYEWEIGRSPWDVPVAEAPKWWLDLLKSDTASRKVPVVTDGQKIKEGGRDEYLYSRANDLVWSGLNYAPILAALREINATEVSPPLDDAQVVQKLNSAWKNHAEALQRKAEIEEGGRMADLIMADHNAKIAESALASTTKHTTKMPDIMPKYGLIRDIAQWIIQTSMIPQPEIAVAAAVAFMSLVAGRRYQTHTGLTLNVYITAILNSGQGKEHSRKCIKQLLRHTGLLEEYGEGIGSGPGLIDALVKNQSRLYLLDEFGYMLQKTMSDKAQGYERQIMTNLMTLYTNNLQTFKTSDLADSTSKKSGQMIESPFVSIYGSATPGQFFDAFRSKNAASGSMARIMIVYPQREWTDFVDVEPTPPPKHIIDQLKEIINQTEEQTGNLPALEAPKQVKINHETRKAWIGIRGALKDRILADEVSASVYSRVGENCLKLMAIQAVATDHIDPLMGADDFEWAYKWALWAADTMMDKYRELSADTEVEGHSKQIENIVKQAGPEGITKTVLFRSYRKVRPHEFKEHFEHLVNSHIVIVATEAKEGAGRRASILVHASHYDPEKHKIE